ncbi:hypothetical protein SAMN05421773_101633 [Streptomyces aidingensis]|uniref:Uncharacterized protein n=1 Tax=Streptomyces aidingensis TaxID=910347 RepID=A0A1I1F7G1_9ACTN|nr:hypothetical protein SAMN05421773_101633 [Streptomyces aidingensis]
MDLRALPLRAAAARPRVLLLPMPGGTAARLAVERELRRRDLPAALTPAEADVVLVAGPGSPALAAAVDRLWRDTPLPRVRAHARTAEEAAGVLEAARARLAAPPALRQEGRDGAGPPRDEGGDDHDGGHDGGGDGHGGHGGHGEMEMPGGLPMAEVGPDRDGLALDRLHIPLGPLLTDWPAGLVLRLTLQGDVIQHAEADTSALRASTLPGPPFWSAPWRRAAAGAPVTAGEAARRRAAARLDGLGRLLAVAGWPAMGTAARRLRDDLLAGAPAAVCAPRARRLAARVGRSRTLYWLTRGIGTGIGTGTTGELPARYRALLAATAEDTARLEDPAPLDPDREPGPRAPESEPSEDVVAALPGLLEGAELATARLIVAALDPDPDELAGAPSGPERPEWPERPGGEVRHD